MSVFKSAKLKVQWADQHITKLNAVLDRFLASDFYSFSLQDDPEAGHQFAQVSAEPIWADIPLILGDAIHSLRSSLDHVATAIIGFDDRNAYFPFHGEVTQFVTCAKVAAIEKASPGLGRYIVDEIRPYTAGNYPLWALNKLDVIDKHKLIIPALGLTTVTIPCLYDEVSRNRFENTTCHVRAGEAFRPLGYAAGKLQLEGKVKASFAVTFPQGGVFENQPIIPTLMQLHQIVSETIESIERFVLGSSGAGPATAA